MTEDSGRKSTSRMKKVEKITPEAEIEGRGYRGREVALAFENNPEEI